MSVFFSGAARRFGRPSVVAACLASFASGSLAAPAAWAADRVTPAIVPVQCRSGCSTGCTGSYDPAPRSWQEGSAAEPHAAPGSSSTPDSGLPSSVTEPMPLDAGSQPGGSMPYGDIGSGRFAALGTSAWTINDPGGGYLDNPIVGTWFRLRYDDANNNPTPDRAEFFYPQCGCASGPGPGGQNPLQSSNRVDYRELAPYFELQLAERLSMFVETPIRFVDISLVDITDKTSSSAGVQSNQGFSDMNAGFKYALYVDEDRYLTGQLRVYAPTGYGKLGLGTSHATIEPSLLYIRRFSDRASWQGELRDWIPISDDKAPSILGPALAGKLWAGNVLRYGVGLNYDLLRTYEGRSPVNPYVAPGWRVTSVTELVGWSVLGGLTTEVVVPKPASVHSAATNIVNFKQGVRVTRNSDSFYVGYGTALTSDVWYQDIVRLEYRHAF